MAARDIRSHLSGIYPLAVVGNIAPLLGLLGTIIGMIEAFALVADFGRGEETSRKSLFILEPLAAVKDLAFWYPKQNPENIVPYPPTIGYGAPEYWGKPRQVQPFLAMYCRAWKINYFLNILTAEHHCCTMFMTTLQKSS